MSKKFNKEVLEISNRIMGEFSYDNLRKSDYRDFWIIFFEYTNRGFYYHINGKCISIQRSLFRYHFKIDNLQIHCSNSLKRNLFRFFVSKERDICNDNIKNTLSLEIIQGFNETEDKILHLVDHIKSNYSKLIRDDVWFVYNDDFIDMSFTSSHLMIGSDKVKTSKRFNREIYTTISNLYSKLEKEKFDSKIDSLVTEVREFKEFKENKNKNK